jgi:hypothetical protein
MKTQEYNNIRADLTTLESDLRGFFSRENFGSNFGVEIINENLNKGGRSGFVLKVRWTWMKLSFVFRVRAASSGSKIIVQVGEEKQSFKMGMAATGGLLLASPIGFLVAPAAITGGIAAYRSHKINDGVWDVIDKHMSDVSREIVDSDHAPHESAF